MAGRVPWAMVAIFVGLALTTCALALQAIVTFPLALATAASGTLVLSPPKGGVVSRHYAFVGVLAAAASVATWLWQRAHS